MIRRLIVAAIGVAGIAAPALAQDAPKAGLTTGYPATIGILWHASDRVAFRPEIAFSQSSNESQGSGAPTPVKGSAWGISFGASALFYTAPIDHLRPYFTPRYIYSRTSTDTTVSGSSSKGSSTVDSHQFSGAFGTQYDLHRRFSVFGEAGVYYSTGKSTYKSGSTVQGKTDTDQWGIRTAIGVVLYF